MIGECFIRVICVVMFTTVLIIILLFKIYLKGVGIDNCYKK